MTASPRPRRALRPAALLLGLVVVVVTSSITVAQEAVADSSVPAGRFYAVTPTRALDTRSNGGPIANGRSRVVDLTRAVGGGDAAAVVINLTVTTPTSSGYLTAYPAGTAKPLASSLNFDKSQTRANSVTVPVGQGANQDQLAIYAAVSGNGTAQVVVDVLGWYGKGGGAQGSVYVPLPSPKRLFDTRARGGIGGLTTSYPKNTGVVTISYGTPDVNKTITAAVMNITATGTRGLGNLTLWNGSGNPPVVSTLNFVAGQTVANLAVVPVRCSTSACKTVTFSIRNNLSPYTQVIGDISGVYTAPTAGGLLYRSIPPSRITDTRLRTPYATLGGGGLGTTSVASRVPSGTRAVNVNLTGVKPTSTTYLTVYPTGTSRPVVSNLNLAPGNVAANAAQVRVGSDGRFTTYNNAGATDVVIDLQGAFVLDPTT